MPIKWNMNVLERRNLDCFRPGCFEPPSVSLPSFSEFFNHFTEYYGMVRSLLFRRIWLSQLAYFQFPVISNSNKEKFVLALVINIIFPVIYFYDDNPLRLSQIPGNALKDSSAICFHTANCNVARQRRKTAFKSMQ